MGGDFKWPRMQEDTVESWSATATGIVNITENLHDRGYEVFNVLARRLPVEFPWDHSACATIRCWTGPRDRHVGLHVSEMLGTARELSYKELR